MRNLQEINQKLLNSEFNEAKGIFEAACAQGFAPVHAAALVYRHGFLDGRDSQKRRTDDAYKKLAEFRGQQISPPEANEEGSTTDE